MVQLKKDRQVAGTVSRVPTPVHGGSESIESLGNWIDKAMGDEEIRKGATAAVLSDAPTQSHDGADKDDAGSSESQGEPVPATPPPVPGGNESITKGDNAPGEKR